MHSVRRAACIRGLCRWVLPVLLLTHLPLPLVAAPPPGLDGNRRRD